MIERATKTKLRISDMVEIEGEPIPVLTAHNIVAAIARGFNPKEAMLLMNEEFGIDIISLHGETEKATKRLMARVIGKAGRSKKTIERETGAIVSIYGKTVAIIGKVGQLAPARDAVELLIKGKTHAYVFKRMKEGFNGKGGFV